VWYFARSRWSTPNRSTNSAYVLLVG
jgi:hypothetical protein